MKQGLKSTALEGRGEEQHNIEVAGLEEPISLTIEFEESLELNVDRREVLIRKVIDYVTTSYTYVVSVVGKDFPLSTQFCFEIRNQEDHKAQGILVRLSKNRIEDVLSSDDAYVDTRENARILHEMLHNLTDDEALPMLFELAFIVEEKALKRLQEIRTLYDQGVLDEQYVRGLEQVATWLEYSDVEAMLDELGSIEVEDLRTKIHRVADEYHT